MLSGSSFVNSPSNLGVPKFDKLCFAGVLIYLIIDSISNESDGTYFLID